MSTVKNKVISKATEMLEKESDGIHYSVLLKKICELLPKTNRGTIKNIIVTLDTYSTDSIYKPAKRLFRHVKFREQEMHLVQETENPKETQFEISVRPIKHEPDMFFVNKNMKLIKKELFV